MIKKIAGFAGRRPLAGVGGIFAAGFTVGVMWLTFIGVPIFNVVPSYLEVRVMAGQSAANEAAITESFDTSEGRRAEETDICRIAVAEAVASEARRCSQIQRAAAFFHDPEGENPKDDVSSPDAPNLGRCVDVQLVPTRGLQRASPPDRDSAGTGPPGG